MKTQSKLLAGLVNLETCDTPKPYLVETPHDTFVVFAVGLNVSRDDFLGADKVVKVKWPGEMWRGLPDGPSDGFVVAAYIDASVVGNQPPGTLLSRILAEKFNEVLQIVQGQFQCAFSPVHAFDINRLGQEVADLVAGTWD